MKTYPINLVLENRLVILIGAKGEITRKISGLLEVGAFIRVIAPTADEVVTQYAAAGEIEWIARSYRTGDLAGAALVIAATNDANVHDAVWAEGTLNSQLVNVMDVLPQCNFHGASLVRQGQLTIAVGTGGAAPALAVTLRKRFEQEFGPEYAAFLSYAQSLRPLVAEQIPDFARRKDFWYALVESKALSLLRQGKEALFEAEVQAILRQYLTTTEAEMSPMPLSVSSK